MGDKYLNIVRVSIKQQEYILEYKPIKDSIQVGFIYGDMKRVLNFIENDRINWDDKNNEIIFPTLTETEKSNYHEWIVIYETNEKHE